MRANKAKDTVPELLLRKALWNAGIKGYRLHMKLIPGRPDISFPRRKIDIFINGCFWHRCPYCNPHFPRSNAAFWEDKFRKNQERDARKQLDLENLGRYVLIIWECEIKKELTKQLAKIIKIYYEKDPHGY